MGLHNRYKDDEEYDTKGTTLELDDDNGPLARIRLARAGGLNKNFTAAVDKVNRKFHKLFQHNMISSDRNREIMIEVHAQTTVLSWETYRDGAWVPGIESENGDILPFTPENVIATFKALPTIYEACVAHASDSQMYNRSYIEEMAKN